MENVTDPSTAMTTAASVAGPKRHLYKVMVDRNLPPSERADAGRQLAAEGWRPDDLYALVKIPVPPSLMPDRPDFRFLIARYPVTNDQFLRFIADGGYENESFWRAEPARPMPTCPAIVNDPMHS